MFPLSLRLRTLIAAALVVALSAIFTVRSIRGEESAARARQGAEVVRALSSAAATLNFAVRDTEAFLTGFLPLIPADPASCQRALDAAQPRSAVAGVIRQVFVVRDDVPVCQSSPGPFSVLRDDGQRHRWAIAPPGDAPLTSGDPILGEISREWVVVVARHSHDQRGMVVASLSLSTLNHLVFDGVPSETLITVIDAEAHTLLRSEAFEERVGHVIPLQSQVESVNASTFGFPVQRTPEGTLTVTQPEPVLSPDAQNVQRIWSGRDLTPMPWVAFAGRRLETIDTMTALQQGVLAAAPTLVLLLVILSLLAGLSRELRGLETYVTQVARDGSTQPPRRFAREFAPLLTVFREGFEARKAAERQLERSNQELSERVEARLKEVRRTEAFRDAVMESAHDALLVVNEQGVIVQANSGVEQILGYSRDALTGRRLADTIVPEEFRLRHQEAFARRLAETTDLRGRRVELPVLRADGSTFPAEIVISTTRVGDQFFSVGFVRDITDRTRAERELRDAMDAANAAARAKSEFLATMSHEIRTPLNGIMGMLDLMIDSPSDANRPERLGIARRSADSLLQLLNDILDYSRLDAGRVELDPVEFNLHLLVAEAADLVSDAARRRGVDVTHRVAGDVPVLCRADRSRLRQILFNLASNAVKFTSSGQVAISAAMTAGPQPRVRLQVEDTGVGISADRLEDIFEPFTQADSSMTRRFGGTGLGLAIVKALVDRMGGTVGVSSQLGIGSTFWVELALPVVSVPKPAEQPQPLAPTPSRILIVEDDRASQLVASESLARAGHRCDVAADGPTALSMAAANHYDAILMDCRLPGMDGWETTRRLRQAGYQAPIIAVTAETSESDTQACLDAGMTAFLAKPVTPARLVNTVAACLHGTSSAERA